MSSLRVAVAGCGFWSRFQIPAWQELPDLECVAVCDLDQAKAERIGQAFGIAHCYQDPAKMLEEQHPDVLDVITAPATHREIVELAVARQVPVICQKPLAPQLTDAIAMVALARRAQVPLYVHENWRWQKPIRGLRNVLASGKIGRAFRARIEFSSSFPVFDNQPFLRDLPQFILADVGPHLLDVVRFLFGEMQEVTCQTHRIHRDIAGEDVATLLLRARTGVSIVVTLSYASRLENERFPETYILVEGENGSIELGPDCWIRVTDESGTLSQRFVSPRYRWADPDYALVHSSIVECHRNLADQLRGTGAKENTGEDNLRTLALVFASYRSAEDGQTIRLSETYDLQPNDNS